MSDRSKFRASNGVGESEHGNDVAICGFSIKFPGDAVSAESFWQMLIEKRCAMTEFPASRFNKDGFYKQEKSLNTIPVKGGHFVQEDLSVFDADFFSISPAEAAAIDPMQRWLLETAFRSLENAGITISSVAGSSTSVYTGSFGLDYGIQVNRDAEFPPLHAGLGFGISMLANRLSWFFDLRGPSIGLDSACSSSAMAIDMACQALLNKSCDMSMVAGCNLTFSPESYTWLNNLNFLSADGKCYSFDHRANGYSRGEGVAVMILKRVSDAVRDGNTIRAVIRSTLSNEDGRTPGITQPSSLAQERLIRATYERAGLSMVPTRYFEAHGTGTSVGDPCEVRAISAAFEDARSVSDPLLIGAVKSSIGHLEGASGLAGVIKAVLVLEKGIIPPNANFEKLNPKIDAQFGELQFPEKCCLWPTKGLRRASVNSFGYGGANCHIVIDDAHHYLQLRSLDGRHCTKISPSCGGGVSCGRNGLSPAEDRICAQKVPIPKLLVWSAADKNGIDRISNAYKDMCRQNSFKLLGYEKWLDNLAYTLNCHRTHLPWRSYALLHSPAELDNLDSRLSAPTRVNLERSLRIGFVFTGQGAQWFRMGRELMCYHSFKADLLSAEEFLRDLGCSWSVTAELARTEETSKVDCTEFSQTLCTVLQVALINLLRRFGIKPSAVLGHSSGEIAAAYAGGYLSSESAWKLAYYRGLCSAQIVEASRSGVPGAMVSVGLPEEQAENLIAAFRQESLAFGISVACINSPTNVTIAGEEHIIDKICTQLKEPAVFVRKLRVPLAYHSRQMEAISEKYTAMIGSLSGSQDATTPMISTVTGELIAPDRLVDPSYWALNMVSTVRFSQAVTNMCAQADIVKKIDRSHIFASVVDHLLEVGPHAALQIPLRDILLTLPRAKVIEYSSVLRRPQSSIETILTAMGDIYCRGAVVNLEAVNQPLEGGGQQSSPELLVDLPEYPFDHSQSYWHESRLSRNYRFREHSPHKLLGIRARDWNPQDARWRHFLRTAELPWAREHNVNGVNLYPAAGMLVMAIEAASQLMNDGRLVHGYTLRNVVFEGPMNLATSTLEVQTSLRELLPRNESGPVFAFTIRSFAHDKWMPNCQGSISVELTLAEEPGSWCGERTYDQLRTIAHEASLRRQRCDIKVDWHSMYAYLEESGLRYGPLFQGVRKQRCNKSGEATAEVKLFSLPDDRKAHPDEEHIIHPVSLDAILHLCFTAYTAGGSRAMATSVPSRIGCLWVSNGGLRSSESGSVLVCTNITGVTKRGFSCDGIGCDTACPEELRLWYEGLELTNVTGTPNRSALPLPNPRQFCMHIESKIALDKLGPAGVNSVLQGLPLPQELDPIPVFKDLELLIDASLKRLISSVDPYILEKDESWRGHYWRWANHHLNRRNNKKYLIDAATPSEVTPDLEDLCDRLEHVNHVTRLYVSVARNLVGIMEGDVNPLEILMQTGILKNYYEEIASYRCSVQVSGYIELLVHQKPGLNILELGGGTGAGTRNLVRNALCAHPERLGGSLRCNRYDFTDVSTAFLNHARDEFNSYGSQMTFGTLDIEHNFAEQGYREQEYDVVLAVSVLHITSNLKQTLCNIRAALRPSGKLIIQESFKADGWTLGFVFGVFPGWWLGSRDNRPLSPCVTTQVWDTILKEAGFSGVDLVLRDFSDDVAHHYGWIVSTAVEEDIPLQPVWPRRPYQATIILDPCSIEQKLLAATLATRLQDALGMKSRVIDITTTISEHEGEADHILIPLVDYGPSFLACLTEASWESLKSLLQKYSHCLWISAGGDRNASPEYGIVDGLARTLRQEHPGIHLVTLALDATSGDVDKTVLILQVLREMVMWVPPQSYEQEYVEQEGFLHTRRLVEANYLKSIMDANLTPYEVSSRPLITQVPFRLSMPSVGTENAPQYIASEPFPGTIQGDMIEVSIKAVSLRSQGQTWTRGFDGGAYAGIILHAGPDAAFSPGDHVFLACRDSFSSHIRTSTKGAVRLCENLSFTDACRELPARIAAYHALVEVGHVQAGDSVLVHDGADLVGYAALQLATAMGVTDLWATATDKTETDWISENTGIARERILPKSWFDSKPLLLSTWKHRWDIVLSVAGPLQSLLTKCVRPGGQYIVRQCQSPVTRDGSYAYSLPSDISISILEGVEAGRDSRIPSRESLQYASTISDSSGLKMVRNNCTEFRASELDDAIDSLQKAHSREPVVVKFDDSDIIDVKIAVQPSYELNRNATYLVCGGLGGLGREIARWLVSRGARHLILLSRSGPRTAEAKSLVSELVRKGIRIQTPCCDAANRSALKSTLTSCLEKMPPIKGCIQAAMVMTESVFNHMDYGSWREAIDPKVKASWNLHVELPRDLDFFVMLSSVMGILGTGSLAGYNAGNTYQDALARYRVTQGECGVSLDIGGVVDGGYLTGLDNFIAGMQRAKEFVPMRTREVCALLDIYCDPNTTLSRDIVSCQAIVGIQPPAYWKTGQAISWTMEQPFWQHMHHVPRPQGQVKEDDTEAGESCTDSKETHSIAQELASKGLLTAEVVSQAIMQRVSTMLGIPADRIDKQKPMHLYGLDSLSAIDLRNWVSEVFSADLPVFEILGGVNFDAVGISIARNTISTMQRN
ncbi:putative polyketide synthase [Hypoxylon sp. NC0597]|nr:putative polyketide synthase [Hypoxylon sp. NC0597]